MSLAFNEVIDKESDIYSLALMLLFQLREDKRYGTLSELSYIMDKKSFMNFISVYGGTTICVPTKAEVDELLQNILYYQYRRVEGMSTSEASIMLTGDATASSINSLERCCHVIENILEETKLKGRGGNNSW